jgi:prepilin-type N-terminal cleavage/methylation domain-containing protein
MPVSKRRNLGFSLVELMVALVAGLLVSTAVVAFALSSMRSNGEYVQSTKLTQELRANMDLIGRELRRAGYDENSIQLMATGTVSPFARMELGNTNTCIVYSYDRAGGISGTRDADRGEIRGIRWKLRKVNNVDVGVMEFAQSSAGKGVACDGATPDYSKYPPACDANSNWCALSDPRVLDITNFLVTPSVQPAGGVMLRNLKVSMTGGLVGKTDVSRTIESNIRVRTDCFDTATNCAKNPSP